jgi:hypothetical protein
MTNNVTLKISKTLRFWVECEYADRRLGSPEIKESKLLAEILGEFEVSGDAMRCLNWSGEIMWKPTPSCGDWLTLNARSKPKWKTGRDA